VIIATQVLGDVVNCVRGDLLRGVPLSQGPEEKINCLLTSNQAAVCSSFAREAFGSEPNALCSGTIPKHLFLVPTMSPTLLPSVLPPHGKRQIGFIDYFRVAVYNRPIL
jgi:hypothetical protein